MALERLFLVRHSKAESSHPLGDASRSLSDEGRRRVSALLPEAAARGFHAQVALSSPLDRALQTRALFASVVGADIEAESPAFTPGAGLDEAWTEVGAWEARGYLSVAVFTHNPFVTDWAHDLLEPGSLEGLTFHTPTILALALPRGLSPRTARPLWVLAP